MKKEDKEISYRHDLSTWLKRCLDIALKFYSVSYREAYYKLKAVLCERDNDVSGAEFFTKVAACFSTNNHMGIEEFFEYYESEMKNKYHEELISEASAANIIFQVYEAEFESIKTAIDTSGFSKMEKFMVEDFFRILTSPMRNPNLQAHEGHVKCYYDREMRSDFKKDLTQQLRYIQETCKSTIELFDTQDESQEVKNLRSKNLRRM